MPNLWESSKDTRLLSNFRKLASWDLALNIYKILIPLPHVEIWEK